MTWNTENSEIVAINGVYVSTSTSKVRIPLAGSTAEAVGHTDVVVRYLPNNKKGRLLSINFMTDSVMGETVFELFESEGAGAIGTVTENISVADVIYRIDFPSRLDAGGTAEFDGDNPIVIGVTPTTAGSTQIFSVVFERSLF